MTCARGCCPSPREHYQSLRYLDHGKGSYHQRDRELSKDMAAYKRLRSEGLQPRTINGAHQLEAIAKTPREVEHVDGNTLRANSGD